jgi:hypothetical protein
VLGDARQSQCCCFLNRRVELLKAVDQRVKSA